MPGLIPPIIPSPQPPKHLEGDSQYSPLTTNGPKDT